MVWNCMACVSYVGDNAETYCLREKQMLISETVSSALYFYICWEAIQTLWLVPLRSRSVKRVKKKLVDSNFILGFQLGFWINNWALFDSRWKSSQHGGILNGQACLSLPSSPIGNFAVQVCHDANTSPHLLVCLSVVRAHLSVCHAVESRSGRYYFSNTWPVFITW